MKKHDLFKKVKEQLVKNLIHSRSGYFALFIGCNSDGKIIFSTQTKWNGWKEINGCRLEIRLPAKVMPNKYRELVQNLGGPAAVVNTVYDLKRYFLVGGHAVVRSQLFNKYFSKHFGKDALAQRSVVSGFQLVENIDQATSRQPKPKLRMRVLNRDQRRCQICGRSPREYLDLELHTHHILPWDMGGLTTEYNLITLCKVCHDGLDPHYDPTLYPTIDIPDEYEQIRLYQRYLIEFLKKQHGA